MISRRELHQGLLSLLALAGCRAAGKGQGQGQMAGAPPRPRPRRAGPRKLLHINLGGGSDVLYSLDPKEPGQVLPGIGPVFTPAQISTRGEVRLGAN